MGHLYIERDVQKYKNQIQINNNLLLAVANPCVHRLPNSNSFIHEYTNTHKDFVKRKQDLLMQKKVATNQTPTPDIGKGSFEIGSDIGH